MCRFVLPPAGYSYERRCIEAWLASKGTSPMTNAPLDPVLIPNR